MEETILSSIRGPQDVRRLELPQLQTLRCAAL